jgi:hypothetical protein
MALAVRRAGRNRVRDRIPALLLAVCCLAFVTACEDDEVTFTGIDCGLVRDHLVGDWTVDYLGSVSRTLTNCSGADPGLEDTTIDVADALVSYPGADVLGSESSPSFKVIADRTDAGDDAAVDQEFVLNIAADSCQTFAWAWESDDGLYVLCIGTFSPGTGTLQATCDSVEVDSDGDGDLDTSCSLSAGIDVSIAVN